MYRYFLYNLIQKLYAVIFGTRKYFIQTLMLFSFFYHTVKVHIKLFALKYDFRFTLQSFQEQQ